MTMTCLVGRLFGCSFTSVLRTSRFWVEAAACGDGGQPVRPMYGGKHQGRARGQRSRIVVVLAKVLNRQAG